MDAFTLAYIEAALWSTMDNADDQGGEPLDANYGLSDISPQTMAKIIEDCHAFQRDNAADIGTDCDRAGLQGEGFVFEFGRVLFLHGLSSDGGRKTAFIQSLGYDVLTPKLSDWSFRRAVQTAQDASTIFAPMWLSEVPEAGPWPCR